MGRRLFLLVLLALTTAAAAGAAIRTGDPLQGQEWFLGAVGAQEQAPPGPGVPLTIIDSGVDASQPDFAHRPNTVYLNAQTVTGTGEFHGTEIASVAAAPENGIGIVGIYPQAALDVWDATPAPGGITSATISAGLAAAHCPGVINLAFGAPQTDPVLEKALVAAQRRGCLVVAAAGNLAENGNPVVYPAAYPHVLAVGATDQNGLVAAFSSTGPWVDLLAPGVGIETDTTTEHASSGNVVDAGTSFSSAIVAAAAAWVWTERPTLTASQVFAILRKATTPTAGSSVGQLSIPAALSAAAPPKDPQEPNETVAEAAVEPALTTSTRRSNRISATLTAVKDPRDDYRIYVPKHGRVRLTVTGPVVVRRVGSYAEVTLRPGVSAASYVLSVTTG